jgi:hypothetical protein
MTGSAFRHVVLPQRERNRWICLTAKARVCSTKLRLAGTDTPVIVPTA